MKMNKHLKDTRPMFFLTSLSQQNDSVLVIIIYEHTHTVLSKVPNQC